jgi:hypothetical protein
LLFAWNAQTEQAIPTETFNKPPVFTLINQPEIKQMIEIYTQNIGSELPVPNSKSLPRLSV